MLVQVHFGPEGHSDNHGDVLYFPGHVLVLPPNCKVTKQDLVTTVVEYEAKEIFLFEGLLSEIMNNVSTMPVPKEKVDYRLLLKSGFTANDGMRFAFSLSLDTEALREEGTKSISTLAVISHELHNKKVVMAICCELFPIEEINDMLFRLGLDETRGVSSGWVVKDRFRYIFDVLSNVKDVDDNNVLIVDLQPN